MGRQHKTFPVSDNIISNMVMKELEVDGDIFYKHLPSSNDEENVVDDQPKQEVSVPDGTGKIDEWSESKKTNVLDNLDKVYAGDKSDAEGYLSGLNEDYNAAVSASQEVKLEKDKNPYKDEPDSDDTAVANSPSQYFDYKVKNSLVNNMDPILPVEVSMDIYGVYGICPGNSLKIDYLPTRYREMTYFVVTKVGHEGSTTGWVTKIETKMRMRSDKMLEHSEIFKYYNIKLSKKALAELGYSPEQVESIWENNLNWEEVAPEPPEDDNDESSG